MHGIARSDSKLQRATDPSTFNPNRTGWWLTTKEADGAGRRLDRQSRLHPGSHAGSAGLPRSASKAAVDAISVSLASELGSRKIRLNSLDPGTVETDALPASVLPKSDFAGS